jgi:hypothetical protein
MATPYIPDEARVEKRFKQKLVELGLLKEVKAPSGVPEGDRTPIKVKGKPLSQSIIEERR